MPGYAAPGESVTLTPPYRARPIVTCTGQLTVNPADITPTQVKFSGTGPGGYQIMGE